MKLTVIPGLNNSLANAFWARELLRVFEGRSGKIESGKFPEGWPQLRIVNPEKNITNRDVVFLTDLTNPAELFSYLAVMYALPRHSAKTFTAVIPFFPTGTMERADQSGDIATAKTLARLLDGIPHSLNGSARIVVYDIHASPEQFFFSDNVQLHLQSALPLITGHLKAELGMVAYPDEGAYKRFRYQLSKCPAVICEKRRGEGEQRLVTVKEGNPTGQRVVLIDDLVRSGGTLLGARQALLNAGAARVDAFITHSDFAPGKQEWFLRQWGGEDGQLSTLYTTDSCPGASMPMPKPWGEKTRCVLSLATLLAEYIREIID